MSNADIGLIGLAVMGENLVLNMANHGYTVAVYNRTTSKVERFLSGSASCLASGSGRFFKMCSGDLGIPEFVPYGCSWIPT